MKTSRLNIGHVIIGLGAVLVLAIMFGPQQQHDQRAEVEQRVMQTLDSLQYLHYNIEKSLFKATLHGSDALEHVRDLTQALQKTFQNLEQHTDVWLTQGEFVTLQMQLRQDIAPLLVTISLNGSWTEAHLTRWMQSSFYSQIQSLKTSLANTKVKNQSQSQSNRYALAMLALLLLTYIAFIIIRLRSASAHLEDSMQDLEHLKFALDQHAIVTMTDADGMITYANDNVCKISLYTHKDLIGKTYDLLKSGYHPTNFFMDMWATINSGQVWRGEIQNKKKNGHKYWVDSTIVPFVNKHGVLERFIAIQSDVTQRKKAEIALKEREKHIRNVLDTALDSVLILDEMGRASYWNPQAERTFGWLAKDIIGLPILDDLFPPEDLRHFQNQSFNSLLKDRVELVAIHQDGHQFPVEVAISLLDSGGDFHFSAFIRDISQRKATEQELKLAHDQALESSRLKSSFLSTVSHEIRTPMNGIIGMTDLILETKLDDEQTEFAETIRQSAEALLCIINDILDFSKIEAGKMSVEPIPFSISSVIGGVIDTLMVKTRDKPVSLLYGIDDTLSDTLVGDPGRIRQILLNLTDNALKFTKEGTVTVKVLHQKTENSVSMVHFEVSDTGIGLSEQGKKNLFQPFSQADGSTTRKYGGTGLGLSICARLITLMGGDIAVQSELGKGSLFYFAIPLPTTASLGESLSTVKQVISQHQATVLLVEDNAVNQRVASLHLKKLGIVPDISNNGQEAVEAIQQQTYDLIFMDCQMPVMDGFEATAQIRRFESAENKQHQPIIAMTANAMKGDKARCLAAGMDDYLSKPIRALDLNAMLHKWLQTTPEMTNDSAVQASVPLVDLAYLEEMFGDDKETIFELMNLFLHSAVELVEKMKACEDSTTLGSLAHELKGAAANVGILGIVGIAKAIEASPDTSDAAAIALLSQQLEQLRQFIGTELAS